jgi:Leucine-rich repeat (LRR) protein
LALVCSAWRHYAYTFVKSFGEYVDKSGMTRKRITRDMLRRYPNLETLSLRRQWAISNDGVTHLRHLRTLSLAYNASVGNDAITCLTQLTALNLCGNHFIRDEGIAHLTNLTSLCLCRNSRITLEGVRTLPNLVHLDYSDPAICSTTPSTCSFRDGLKQLTQLVSLSLAVNALSVDAGLRGLTNLVYLSLRGNGLITDLGLQDLVSLSYLDLSYNQLITDDGVTRLTNLTYLDVFCEPYDTHLTREGVAALPKLRKFLCVGARRWLDLQRVAKQDLEICFCGKTDAEATRPEVLEHEPFQLKYL